MKLKMSNFMWLIKHFLFSVYFHLVFAMSLWEVLMVKTLEFQTWGQKLWKDLSWMFKLKCNLWWCSVWPYRSPAWTMYSFCKMSPGLHGASNSVKFLWKGLFTIWFLLFLVFFSHLLNQSLLSICLLETVSSYTDWFLKYAFCYKILCGRINSVSLKWFSHFFPV